jgi:hypothetical protein
MVQPLSSPTKNSAAKIEGTRIARIARILKNCAEAIAIRIQALSLYQIDSVLACFEELNLCLFITSKSITYSPVYGRLGRTAEYVVFFFFVIIKDAEWKNKILRGCGSIDQKMLVKCKEMSILLIH